jgi:hypothetical protein
MLANLAQACSSKNDIEYALEMHQYSDFEAAAAAVHVAASIMLKIS